MTEDNKNKENNTSKDSAKSKIILFVIGVLLGAVISTSSLLIGINIAGKNRPENFPQRQRPDFSSNMPGGQNNNQRMQNDRKNIPQRGQNSENENAQDLPEKPDSKNDNDQKTK